jgi:hypothetical protein
MAFRSLLPHAARDGQPNAMTCNYDGVTTSQVVEALRCDHAWDDLNSDGKRRERAGKLRFMNWLVRRGVVSDWRVVVEGPEVEP